MYLGAVRLTRTMRRPTIVDYNKQLVCEAPTFSLSWFCTFIEAVVRTEPIFAIFGLPNYDPISVTVLPPMAIRLENISAQMYSYVHFWSEANRSL